MDPAWLGEANDAVDAMEPSAPPPGAGQTIESWNEQFPEDAEAVSSTILLQSICPANDSIEFDSINDRVGRHRRRRSSGSVGCGWAASSRGRSPSACPSAA